MDNVLTINNNDVKINLPYFKFSKQAISPKFSTKNSACFDLYACIEENVSIKGYDVYNREFKQTPYIVGDKALIHLPPKSRTLVPTGLIFDIPYEHSIRLYIRSGVAFKQGLQLANSEGIVDSDYVEPVYVIIYNVTNQRIQIIHGDRLCQGELRKDLPTKFEELIERPEQKTDRAGGFGSTGK